MSAPREAGSGPLAVLDARLHVIAPFLLGAGQVDEVSRTARGAAAGTTSALLLPHLLRAARSWPDTSAIWLTLTALAGALPTDEEVLDARRHLELTDDDDALHLLDTALEISDRTTTWSRLEVALDTVVVDVDFCARHDIHTGIQRVVRETLPRWMAQHEISPVAWTDDYTALRRLRPLEEELVFHYTADGPRAPRVALEVPPDVLVVPWRSRLLIPEIPEPVASPFLLALARHSGNTLAAVGYDMIPIVSADLRPGQEATRFTRYLDVIKHVDRVAAISSSSAQEFAGFSSALTSQGLTGPSVVEVVLPGADPLGASPADRATDSCRPVVLCIGTHDPHKNHSTVLHAAERLWREGLEFDVVFIGGRGWRNNAEGMCYDDALAAGRPVHDRGKVSDADLSRALRDAAFTVFLSLHEGFGLPVAESLAAGTPVITSNFGSLAELAAPGGCLAIDPRDDEAVVAALRALLTDPSVLARLRAEIATRPTRTWETYATELWSTLVTDGAR